MDNFDLKKYISEGKLLKENSNLGLTGDVDFRYDETLRLAFDSPAYNGEGDDEDQMDAINSRLYELLDGVSDGNMEIDWRDNQEVEIHGIDQNKFYAKYDESFISLI